MESPPQNPEFSINPENFHPWVFLTDPKGQLHGDKGIAGVPVSCGVPVSSGKAFYI